MTYLRWCLPCPVLVAILVAAAVPSAAQSIAPPPVADGRVSLRVDDCGDGVVKDDGTLESGYGWVPSVIDGRYVQRFELAEFGSRKIEEVCVCWTRTRPDEDLSFQVQLYRDRGGRPADYPDASVAAMATLVPTYPDGAFYSIDVSDADMMATTGVFYIGVQWNASVDQFFFVCVDQTDTTPVVDGWFIDDRADEWTSVLESIDPIFNAHRAMMIRARSAEGYYALVPTIGGVGIVVLVLVIGAIGAFLLRRRDD